jgi:hypothetical protein
MSGWRESMAEMGAGEGGEGGRPPRCAACNAGAPHDSPVARIIRSGAKSKHSGSAADARAIIAALETISMY